MIPKFRAWDAGFAKEVEWWQFGEFVFTAGKNTKSTDRNFFVANDVEKNIIKQALNFALFAIKNFNQKEIKNFVVKNTEFYMVKGRR